MLRGWRKMIVSRWRLLLSGLEVEEDEEEEVVNSLSQLLIWVRASLSLQALQKMSMIRVARSKLEI